MNAKNGDVGAGADAEQVQVKEHLRAAKDAAASAARARARRARNWASSQIDDLQQRVEQQPYVASAWALGVGFLAGIVGTQFIVVHSLPRFVVFFGASVVHAVVFMGLYVLLDLRHFGAPYAAVAGQAAGNAFIGVVAFRIVELLPGAVERHRAARTRLRR